MALESTENSLNVRVEFPIRLLETVRAISFGTALRLRCGLGFRRNDRHVRLMVGNYSYDSTILIGI